MKIWIAMSADYATRKASAYCTYTTYSTSALAPCRTREMIEDNLYWFEAEVLRRMEGPIQNRDWEEQRSRTLFYQYRNPHDPTLYD